MPAFIDLTDERIGRWTVLYRDGTHKYGGAQWRCRCDCGTEKTLRGQALLQRQSHSCGCYNKDVHRELCIKRNTKHGHGSTDKRSRPRTYRIWSNLSARHKAPCYAGVSVCSRWKSYENFLSDMGECPSEKHTIDRIDNSRGYEPGNCRWATMKQQQNNRTNNRKIVFNGKTKTLMQWSEETGIARETISRRLDRLGWSIEKALTMPAQVGRNQYSNQ